jgi:hypothetical protein
MSRNTGKRPHELTLELFAQNATQSPSEIDAFVKNGPYCSKSIWFLRKLGHDISVSKSGRTVLSYTYNGTGTSTPTAPKPVKAPKRQVADPAAAKQNKLRPAVDHSASNKLIAKFLKSKKTDEQIKAANLAKMKKVSAKLAKRKSKKIVDVVEKELGTSGEIATSYNIDPAWDSTEGLDIRKLVA